MVQASGVLKVSSINGELIVSVDLALDAVEFSFERVVAGPWIGSATLKDIHAMIDGRAIECTKHIDLSWRGVRVGVCREDDVPLFVDVV